MEMNQAHDEALQTQQRAVEQVHPDGRPPTERREQRQNQGLQEGNGDEHLRAPELPERMELLEVVAESDLDLHDIADGRERCHTTGTQE
eukprot:CAMPEP_0177411732 /NCGR_PEP_ID=MMETSP0368-20130122/65614_1 /TAXON_ID=447022 ORGANISM="Scrippsiella hangoei-like, Strain SHHI-4" /NCGR_SAMPLE_ID=MMETSP0368 /ASSEMBLY_ACC=CAM_ASM_000363 /LENGTH=88 /DNA_ID=CAMNT_0018880947 /DNA_START=117 /DNA_END=383 /DNA_ORIENTATION=-